MNSIKVKKEFLPTRCETCHKTDCFDPKANICSRCANVEEEKNPTTLTKRIFDYGDIGLICGAAIGIASGILIAIIRQYLQTYSSIDISTNSLNFEGAIWGVIGLALLGAVWGAAIGETIKTICKRKK
ncbi:MAG: hypothetical protein HY819_25160 [Acidobacteria bacterium]|nr:hypothetical protein [Acidobacteriota bacterium]